LLKAGTNWILLYVKDPINIFVVDQKGACQEIYGLPALLNAEWLILKRGERVSVSDYVCCLS
jgi:hypothetical protein